MVDDVSWRLATRRREHVAERASEEKQRRRGE